LTDVNDLKSLLAASSSGLGILIEAGNVSRSLATVQQTA